MRKLDRDVPLARAPHARAAWRVTTALTFALALGSAFPSLPFGVRNWDNMVKLQVANNFLRGDGPVLTRPTPDDAGYVVRGVDGKAYSGYPLLASALQLLTILLSRAGGPTVEGFPTLLLLAATAAILVAWGRRRGVSPPAAVAGAMLACFGTMLWPLAAQGYDNVVEPLALAAVLWAGAGEDRARDWALAGAAVGLATATRVAALLLAVPAAVALLAERRRGVAPLVRRVAAFGAGVAPGLFTLLAWNAYRFGSPFALTGATAEASPADLTQPWFSAQHWVGMAGLLASPGKGIVWYAPPLLGAVLLARALWKRHRAATATLGAYLVASVFMFGRLTYWHGEWGWGPRYVAAACLFAAPVAWWAWERAAASRGMRVAAAVALAALVAVEALPTIGQPVACHLATTMKELAASGRLASTDVLRPPVPADDAFLYFDPRNAMQLSLARCLATHVPEHDVFGSELRSSLALAMLVPAAALALVAAAAWLEDRARRALPAADRVDAS